MNEMDPEELLKRMLGTMDEAIMFGKARDRLELAKWVTEMSLKFNMTPAEVMGRLKETIRIISSEK
mgnify:CR=1 FL=1